MPCRILWLEGRLFRRTISKPTRQRAVLSEEVSKVNVGREGQLNNPAENDLSRSLE